MIFILISNKQIRTEEVCQFLGWYYVWLRGNGTPPLLVCDVLPFEIKNEYDFSSIAKFDNFPCNSFS